MGKERNMTNKLDVLLAMTPVWKNMVENGEVANYQGDPSPFVDKYRKALNSQSVQELWDLYQKLSNENGPEMKQAVKKILTASQINPVGLNGLEKIGVHTQMYLLLFGQLKNLEGVKNPLEVKEETPDPSPSLSNQ